MRKQGADYEKFAAENSGKPIIARPQLIRCESYCDAFNRNASAKRLLLGCTFEETICVELNGVKVKARFDSINSESAYIADVKTSSYPVDLDSFRTTVKQWGYDLSAALYCMVASKHYEKPFGFYWQAINKQNPHCEVYKCSDATMQKAVIQVTEALNIYKNCLTSGDWSTKLKEVEASDEILEV